MFYAIHCYNVEDEVTTWTKALATTPAQAAHIRMHLDRLIKDSAQPS